ncbi:MAG: P-loop NTPase fold protein [Bacteroidota bacterium]
MNKPFIVGITGGSGSGKTTFVKKLMKDLSGASLHSMDNYYKEIGQQPLDENEIENFDRLESVDIDKYVEDLRKLISGASLEIDEYTFNNEKSTSRRIKVESHPIILLEGIFVLYVKRIREQINLKLYIETPDYLRMSRRIIRDAEERGYNLKDVLYRYQYHVTPAFKNYIESSKEWADLIIPNYSGFDSALSVVRTFLHQHLLDNQK